MVLGRALLVTSVVGVLGSLAACGSGSGPSQASETVVIDIEHSAFEPTTLAADEERRLPPMDAAGQEKARRWIDLLVSDPVA